MYNNMYYTCVEGLVVRRMLGESYSMINVQQLCMLLYDDLQQNYEHVT